MNWSFSYNSFVKLSLYYTINTDMDITQLGCDSQFFYQGILQRKCRKMTMTMDIFL